MVRLFVIACAVLASFVSPAIVGIDRASAQEISLPLAGYYRPGRWMPVQWTGSSSEADLRIDSAQAITTTIARPASVGIAPWMLLDRLTGPLRCTQGTSHSQIEADHFHMLAPDERLVGVFDSTSATAGNLAGLADLFPGQSVIPIALDEAAPLPGAALAWETLDAIVLTPGALANIPRQNLLLLYANGTTLLIAGEKPAAPDFNWQKDGNWWIARWGLSPPPLFAPDGYRAVRDWQPGKSATVRWRIALISIVIAILFGAIALWRSRWMPAVQLAFAAVVVAAIFLVGAGQSTVATAGGNVFVMDKHAAIQDTWIYQRSAPDADFSIAISGIVHPIFYNRVQSDWTHLSLTCDGTGEPVKLTGRLRKGWPMAAMIRAPAARMPTPAPGVIDTPLRLLATRALYPDFAAAGQAVDHAISPSRWPDLILRPAR